MASSKDETHEKTVYVSRERKLEKLTSDGFGNKFLDNVDDFECPICVLVTRDALQISTCGHRFCSTCWEDWTRSSPTPTCCPIDGEEVDPNWVFPDRNADRKIRGLKVFCGNQELGCDATLELRDLEVHQSKCQYQTVACELGCGERVFVWAVDEHLQHDCPRRWMACEACGEQLMAGGLQAHTGTCPMKVVNCDLCHLEGLLNKDLVAHTDRDCPSYPTHCSFGMLGCTDKVIRSELSAHHQVWALQHLALINSALSSVYEGEVAGVIQGPRYELPAPLWGRVGNVVKLATNQQITDTDVKLTNEIDTLKQRNVELTNDISNIQENHNLKMQEQDQKIQEQHTKMQEQDHKIQEQHTKMQEQDHKIQEQHTKMQEQDHKIQEQHTKMQEQDHKIQEQHTKMQEQDHIIQEQHTKIKELEDANQRVMKLCENMEKKFEKLEKGMKGEKSGSEVKGGAVQVGAWDGGSGVGGQVLGVSGGKGGVVQSTGGVGGGVDVGGVVRPMEILKGVRITCPCYWRVKVTREMEVYSPPFYTQDGYKMCLGVECDWLVLDVDCYLMPGERDGELRWPWAGRKVGMTVREVGSGRELVGECGVAGVGYPGRDRPQGERNGVSLFYNIIPHTGEGVMIEITVT